MITRDGGSPSATAGDRPVEAIVIRAALLAGFPRRTGKRCQASYVAGRCLGQTGVISRALPDIYLTTTRRRGERLVDDAERRAVLDAWFRAHSARVLAYLLHRTDPQTAQDVLQEVFVTAYGKADQIADPPVGWLFGTARRLLANRQRGFRRQDQLIARLMDEVGREQDGDAYELKQAFAMTLAAVPRADREVLTLTGWYGLTPAEAAEALGCSVSAYGVRLHRARRRLASALEAAGYRGATPAGRLAEALRG